MQSIGGLSSCYSFRSLYYVSFSFNITSKSDTCILKCLSALCSCSTSTCYPSASTSCTSRVAWVVVFAGCIDGDTRRHSQLGIVYADGRT